MSPHGRNMPLAVPHLLMAPLHPLHSILGVAQASACVSPRSPPLPSAPLLSSPLPTLCLDGLIWIHGFTYPHRSPCLLIWFLNSRGTSAINVALLFVCWGISNWAHQEPDFSLPKSTVKPATPNLLTPDTSVNQFPRWKPRSHTHFLFSYSPHSIDCHGLSLLSARGIWTPCSPPSQLLPP